MNLLDQQGMDKGILSELNVVQDSYIIVKFYPMTSGIMDFIFQLSTSYMLKISQEHINLEWDSKKLLPLWRINRYIAITIELSLHYSAYPIIIATESRLFFSKRMRG